MAIEDYPLILEGAIDQNAIIQECVANGAIPQWSPVILVAAGSGETLPRVGTTTTSADENVYGVKVYPNKTVAAGDIVYVVVYGRCKCKVNAATTSLKRALMTSTVAGSATPVITAENTSATFAEVVGTAATAAGDIIAVMVKPGGGGIIA